MLGVFVEAVGDHAAGEALTWLVFGESDRPPMDYDACAAGAFRAPRRGLNHLASHHSNGHGGLLARTQCQPGLSLAAVVLRISAKDS